MDKEDVFCEYIKWNIFQSEKNENFPFAAVWMDLEGFILSEISQIEKNKHCMLSLTCGIQKMKNI